MRSSLLQVVGLGDEGRGCLNSVRASGAAALRSESTLHRDHVHTVPVVLLQTFLSQTLMLMASREYRMLLHGLLSLLNLLIGWIGTFKLA